VSKLYSIDDTFFEKINYENKAYFLGLMYADGNINPNRIKIGLQENDKDILEKFKEAIKYSGPLIFRKGGERNDGWGIRKNQYILQIANQKISKDLNNLGCVPNKSLILQFPTENQVSKHLIRHFIRGIMDGDGYFSKYFIKNNWVKYQVNLVSTSMFIDKLSEELKKELQINTYNCKRHKNKETPTRQMFISGRIHVMKFLDWIYNNSTIHLTRKYNKYKRIRKCEK
jgi:hypothetical protein